MQSDRQNRNFSPLCLAAGEKTDSPTSNLRSRLAEIASRFDETHAFVKGQFVRWKPGLKNRKLPDYGEPAIVREVLSTPLFDPCEEAACTGSPYFGEPLTLVLGTLDPEGDLLEFRYDGRRFEPCDD